MLTFRGLPTLIIMMVLSGNATAADTAVCRSQSPAHHVPLVELFTSEGCSSCPPADRWLREIGQSWRGRITPLSLHVDYWNQLGWPDPYSSPQFTQRQRMLATRNGARSVYTPGVFVDGKELSAGRHAKDLSAYLQCQAQQAVTEQLVIEWSKSATGEFVPVVTAHSNKPRQATLHIVIYQNGLTQQVTRGENAGERLVHDFVVRNWATPITLQASPQRVTVAIPSSLSKELANSRYGVTAVLEESLTGDILQIWSAEKCFL